MALHFVEALSEVLNQAVLFCFDEDAQCSCDPQAMKPGDPSSGFFVNGDRSNPTLDRSLDHTGFSKEKAGESRGEGRGGVEGRGRGRLET